MTGSTQFQTESSDCGSTQRFEMVESVKVSGVGYTFVEEKENGNVSQAGINGYWGSIKEKSTDLQTPFSVSKSSMDIIGINPYFQYDWKLFGMGLGIHAGSIATLKSPEYNSNERPSYLKNIGAFPSAYFRIGYVNKVFGEMKLAQQFPSPFPSASFQTNIGFGFGKQNGGAIRIGTSTYTGIFIAPSIPIGNQLILESYFGTAPGGLLPKFNTHSQNDEQEYNWTGSISVRYKFGNKNK